MCDSFEYLSVIRAWTSRFMGGSDTTIFKRLVSLIAAQCDQPVMAWIRCSISFSLLRSAVTWLRGVRSHHAAQCLLELFDFAVSEGQMLPSH